jgi:glycosyltransferase involved in cell wall biosynthesis
MNAARGPVVLQVLPALDGGGVERGTIEIAEAIARAGGTAIVASAGGRLLAELRHRGAEHVALPLDTKRPWAIYANAGRLETLIAARGVELVHARSRAPAWSAWLAARRAGVPFVTTYHAPYGEAVPGKRAYNAIMARGARVIAISDFIAREVSRRHGVDPARIRVIPRGVDPAIFDAGCVSVQRRERLARAWGLPPGRPVVMLPARLSRWKGHDVLIGAMARLAAPDALAVLVGGEPSRRYGRALIARAARLGLGERIRMVPHCDDMPAALALASVVVNASTQPEGFGRVIIEAQAMARPVIAADHGGAAETIEHGVTGFRVPPADAAALAEAIAGVLAMPPAAREALGARARAAVRDKYTTRAMQDATLAVYEEVLSCRFPGGSAR